jgi:glucose-1-phosphate adenylyltransferase
MGTADAVYQNIDIIDGYGPEYLVILAGDHVYKMDYERMLVQHVNSGADVTVGCVEVPRGGAKGFGVMHVGADGRILDFVEKPPQPPEMPDKPGWRSRAWASTSSGATFLNEQLRRDAADPDSSRDFGKDIIPYLVKHGKAVAHRFTESCVRSAPRTRPTGATSARSTPTGRPTSTSPTSCRSSTCTTSDWPIWTYAEITPPAKFVHDLDGRRGEAISALVSGGCIVSGAVVRRSLLFTGVQVHSFANVENGVILPYVDIARGARLKNVVVDHGVRIPEGLIVGEDPVLDAARFRRSAGGVCLITQPMIDQLGA